MLHSTRQVLLLALASETAAKLRSAYPSFWPETIRALMVHSARWTPQMLSHFEETKKLTAKRRLLRRYGYGVPTFTNASRSADDCLTLVTQEEIRPVRQSETTGQKVLGDVHFFELPWPIDLLRSLGATDVRLQITLSYFIEPNIRQRSWFRQHRYASHGLRFALKSPGDSDEKFYKQINKLALENDEKKSALAQPNWYLGPTTHNKGSIHSDHFIESAADIADRRTIAIYPVGGWWNTRKKLDETRERVRYSLVVSLESEAQELWTSVATKIGQAVEALIEL